MCAIQLQIYLEMITLPKYIWTSKFYMPYNGTLTGDSIAMFRCNRMDNSLQSRVDKNPVESWRNTALHQSFGGPCQGEGGCISPSYGTAQLIRCGLHVQGMLVIFAFLQFRNTLAFISRLNCWCCMQYSRLSIESALSGDRRINTFQDVARQCEKETRFLQLVLYQKNG